MEFKIFCCDNQVVLENVLNRFSERGYADCRYDLSHCASMEFIPNNRRYYESRLVFRDAANRMLLETAVGY